jgi:N-methylhydantoinase A
MLDVHTVGAGGGSIAWRDPGGVLRVGPHSAGADPGPACYGRGGADPTVTDANLLLGRLSPGSPLAGGVRLDLEAARAAVDRLAGELGISSGECSEGIVRVASAEMARALRVVSVQRGVDPRRYALLPFGGAGPMHATAVADELGMDRIVCPPASGVLAALGLVVSERRRDAQRSVLRRGDELTAEAIESDWRDLARAARGALDAEAPALRAAYDLRYRGQAFELTVEHADRPASPRELRAGFEALHEERYGYRDPDAEVELVTLRVTAAVPGEEVSLEEAAAARGARDPASRRDTVFAGRSLPTPVWDGAPAPGCEVAGPAICELGESTLVVSPGWVARGHPTGAVVLERAG